MRGRIGYSLDFNDWAGQGHGKSERSNYEIGQRCACRRREVRMVVTRISVPLGTSWPEQQKIPGPLTWDYCGAKGIRTPDPHTASVVRYQLRHSPMFSSACPHEVTPRRRALKISALGTANILCYFLHTPNLR